MSSAQSRDRSDDVVERAIKVMQSKVRLTEPWKFDEPWNQTYKIYSLDEKKWTAKNASGSNEEHSPASDKISRFALYSWNIDFMLPYADSRMRCALRHLESLVKPLPDTTAPAIFLQECLESDLELLASDAWIQRTFAITDLDIENWQSGHYGTVTLVDRRLEVKSVFRVHYSQTSMQRDVLVTDLVLSSTDGTERRLIRLCNTHLESLALKPPRRPSQMKLIAGYMRSTSVQGAAVAGDFNAIQDFDRHLHSDNDLKDAFLELGGSEDDAEGGHTWGQQASTKQRERYGTSRMDKAFFCGGLRCLAFERFGAGVEVEDNGERADLVALGFARPWVTDHLGVRAVFEVQ